MAPRMYLALDSGFTSSAAIEELGEESGPAGPMVVIALLCEAKRQGAGGTVRTTANTLARAAFLRGADQAHSIVANAVKVGTLEAIDIDERTIHVRFVRWSDWQPRGRDALRKAQEREAELNGTGDPAHVGEEVA